MVGLTAGESSNPARDVPRAIKLVFWRVLILYLGGIFFLSICIPYNADGLLHAASKTASSPFVIAFTRAGLNAGGDVVNAFIVSHSVISLTPAHYPRLCHQWRSLCLESMCHCSRSYRQGAKSPRVH